MSITQEDLESYFVGAVGGGAGGVIASFYNSGNFITLVAAGVAGVGVGIIIDDYLDSPKSLIFGGITGLAASLFLSFNALATGEGAITTLEGLETSQINLQEEFPDSGVAIAEPAPVIEIEGTGCPQVLFTDGSVLDVPDTCSVTVYGVALPENSNVLIEGQGCPWKFFTHAGKMDVPNWCNVKTASLPAPAL